MAQRRGKASPAISSQPHACIINQSGFGNRSVARAVWQSNRQRRRHPFTIFDIIDCLLFVSAFVVTFEVMEPGDAAGRKREGGTFIRYALPCPRNYKTKSDAVVEGADLELIVGTVLMS